MQNLKWYILSNDIEVITGRERASLLDVLSFNREKQPESIVKIRKEIVKKLFSSSTSRSELNILLTKLLPLWNDYSRTL